MEAVSNNGEPFGLLPDEMVVYTLSFVDADSLLCCRLVCRSWRQLIDAYVYQEKASCENQSVNDGRGYYSFSQIDSKTVRKLDFPWYVFYTICKHDPFNRNLVKNNCGQSKFDVSRRYHITYKCRWVLVLKCSTGEPIREVYLLS